MSTTSFVKQAGIADDAGFRAVGKAVSDAMTAVGFIKTADSGQIDWTTVLKGASAGYEIRQLPDSTLQTANPVLVKIVYGYGSTSILFGMTFQVGHTTNGAGTFTGTAGSVQTCNANADNAAGSLCFLSCDAEHFSMALFLGTAGSTTRYSCVFGIDRLRDVDGTALSTGVNVITHGSTTAIQQSILPSGSGAQFPTTPLASPMCLYVPATSQAATMGAGICFSNVYPYLGCAGNPDMNFIIYPAEVLASPGGTIIEIPIYGVNHKYVLAGGYTAMLGNNSAANWNLGIRYD